MRCVRVWFSKVGMSRYVSHLDLMRAMTRAVRRAGVPLWYTEGYNPHPYMTFPLPLSLGMESREDSMDIRIEGESTNEDIYSMLKDNMPPGISVLSVGEPVYDPKHIAYARFNIEFTDFADGEELCRVIDGLLSSKSLIVQKLGKKGRHKVLKDIDLIEHIKESKTENLGDRVCLKVILPAGSVTNVNPSLLADEIVKNYPDIAYVIMREALLTENMEIFR